MDREEALRYSILDPTGNITALVESRVPTEQQPAVAAALMRRHPEVEQVGFLRLADRMDAPVRGELRMAGGEFCGNASMSAAALACLHGPRGDESPETVRLCVSGAAQPVEVRLWREAADSFRAAVRMPPALGVDSAALRFGGLSGPLPLVRMQGISHLVIDAESVFFPLREDRPAAEAAVRAWCEALAAEGLGLMFLEAAAGAYRLCPLVCIPGSGTVFWENSCASGSAAVGICLAVRSGAPVRLALQEPGGELRVESDPAGGETWLFGRTRLMAQYPDL